jgi:hypothetical protein
MEIKMVKYLLAIIVSFALLPVNAFSEEKVSAAHEEAPAAEQHDKEHKEEEKKAE